MKNKKLILAAVAVVAVIAIMAGIWFATRGGGEPVNVYPFEYIGMTEFWGDAQESYGPVTTDKIQTEFLSDTQTITEVAVKDGDMVKKGDVLFSFDTTLDALSLERKRLEVEKVKVQIKAAEERLAEVRKLEPYMPAPEKEPEKENLGDKAHVVGNIMYDSFLHFANKPWDNPEVIGLDGTPVVIPEEFYFMTCHRQENTFSDEPLTEILAAMDSLDAPTIYAVHPRNHERAKRVVANNGFKNIILTQPVKYSDSVQLVSRAKKVVTDSGGLQCEAFYAGVQCVLVMDYVVWPETMVYNRNQLAKPDREDILTKLSAKQHVMPEYKPFGDGHAAEKITQLITEFFENRK